MVKLSELINCHLESTTPTLGVTDIKINVYKPCSAALSPSWGFSNTIIWPPLVWLRLRGGPKVSFLRKKGHSQQRFGGTVPTAFQHPGPAFLGDPWCATRPFWKTGVFAPGSSPDSVMAPSQPPGKGRGRTSAPGIRCAAASPAGRAEVGGAWDRTISHRGVADFPWATRREARQVGTAVPAAHWKVALRPRSSRPLGSGLGSGAGAADPGAVHPPGWDRRAGGGARGGRRCPCGAGRVAGL